MCWLRGLCGDGRFNCWWFWWRGRNIVGCWWKVRCSFMRVLGWIGVYFVFKIHLCSLGHWNINHWIHRMLSYNFQWNMMSVFDELSVIIRLFLCFLLCFSRDRLWGCHLDRCWIFLQICIFCYHILLSCGPILSEKRSLRVSDLSTIVYQDLHLRLTESDLESTHRLNNDISHNNRQW